MRTHRKCPRVITNMMFMVLNAKITTMLLLPLMTLVMLLMTLVMMMMMTVVMMTLTMLLCQ